MSNFCQSLYNRMNKMMENPFLLGVGITVNLSFTYLVYPFAVLRAGFVKGGMVMTFLTLALNYMAISFYTRSGRDLFGIEAMKKRIQNMQGRSRAGRLIAGAIKKSGFIAFVVLSVKFDPFITTVYLRRGGFHGLDLRDRLIFLSSAAIGNGYCIFLMFGGGTLIKYIKSIL